jgi:hypothetical protein
MTGALIKNGRQLTAALERRDALSRINTRQLNCHMRTANENPQ